MTSESFKFDAEQFYDGKTKKDVIYGSKIVNSLAEYWHIKGLFGIARGQPHIAKDIEYQKSIHNFLTRYSCIDDHRCWNRLSVEEQYKLCSCFSILEDEALQVTIPCNDYSGQLCVVLKGNGTLRNNFNSEEIVLHQGHCFGAIDIFNSIFDIKDPMDWSEDEEDEKVKKIEEIDKEYFANIDKCSILRLLVRDYKKQLVIVPEENYDDDVSLVSDKDFEFVEGFIPSEEDLKCLKARKMSNRTMSNLLYTFLNKTDLLPKLAADTSKEYIKNESAGRKITLSYGDQQFVYIIISGRARIQIELKGETGGILSFKKKNDDDENNVFKMKRKNMPLMLLELGAIMTFHEEFFKVGIPPQPIIDKTPEYKGSKPEDIKTRLRKSRESRLPPKTLYQISLVFEIMTTYLAIPFKKFSSALANVARRESFAIRSELDDASQTALDRVESLLPWIVDHLYIEHTQGIKSEQDLEEELKKCNQIPIDWHVFPLKGEECFAEAKFNPNDCVGSSQVFRPV